VWRRLHRRRGWQNHLVNADKLCSFDALPVRAIPVVRV
jgi:hypothetical protein